MLNTETGYMESLENLFNALEIYRDMQEKLIKRAEEILKEYGIPLEKPEIAVTNADEIRRRLYEEAEKRKAREAAMVAEQSNDYHAVKTPAGDVQSADIRVMDAYARAEEKEESRCRR